jgi:hypothetical protein
MSEPLNMLCRVLHRDLESLIEDVVWTAHPGLDDDDEAFLAECDRLKGLTVDALQSVKGNRPDDTETTRGDLKYILLAHFRVLSEELEKA